MVADASVMPLIPNGNVHSTVCVVAERAVEFILGPKEWARAEKRIREEEQKKKESGGNKNTTTNTTEKREGGGGRRRNN